jgi:hypothetical protein
MRIVFFIILFILALTVPFVWFLIPLAAYLLLWTGYELLLIGVVVDSVFGGGQLSYLYTVSIGIGVIIFESIRPYMSWYDTNTAQI